MCRLFAFVSPDRSTAERELGDRGMESLRSLARLHGDGWGWAGVASPGDHPVLRKAASSAASDPAFADSMTRDVRAAVVHLRWATSGLPVRPENAHPFSSGRFAFAHNGSLKPIGLIRGMLSAEQRAALEGDTDSEMYFTLIRERVAAGIPLAEAALEVARLLREEFPLASLNALILDAEQLVVVHASALSILSDDDLGAIARFDHLPDEHNEDYFALRWKRTADGTLLVGSTGVAGPDWRPMPPESVTSIDLRDRSCETVALAGERMPLVAAGR